jgi:hypothetical protein
MEPSVILFILYYIFTTYIYPTTIIPAHPPTAFFSNHLSPSLLIPVTLTNSTTDTTQISIISKMGGLDTLPLVTITYNTSGKGVMEVGEEVVQIEVDSSSPCLCLRGSSH